MNCLVSKAYYVQVLSKIQPIFFCLVKEENCSRVELYSSKTLNNALNSVRKKTELLLYESERKNLSLSLRHVVLLYHSTIY